MSLALVLSLTVGELPPSHHPLSDHLQQLSGLPLPGKLQTGGKIQTFAIPEVLYSSRYFTCQLGQPNIKLHGKIFGYVLSFSAANSFCKRPWDCTWGSLVTEPGRRQTLEPKKQQKAPRKAGVRGGTLMSPGFAILPDCSK